MVQLSAHFSLDEFEKDGPIPAECVPAFQILCVDILESTRQQFDVPFAVTSGYRDPTANTEAHGQPNSEHMATKDWCAADFFPSGSVREVFDWMRNSPTLPYHQLILEHGANGSSIIHVSWNRLKPGVRSVLEGAEHNASPYIVCDHVAYAPPNNAGDVATAVAEG